MFRHSVRILTHREGHKGIHTSKIDSKDNSEEKETIINVWREGQEGHIQTMTDSPSRHRPQHTHSCIHTQTSSEDTRNRPYRHTLPH